MRNIKKTLLQDESGLATIEALPLLFLFLLVLSFGFGSFGIIHSGILNSIAARNYAFETFRSRSTLTYFRDNSPRLIVLKAAGTRIHAIQSELRNDNSDGSFEATERNISMGITTAPLNNRNQSEVHLNRAPSTIEDGVRNETISLNPVWLMTQYGICLNSRCGDTL